MRHHWWLYQSPPLSRFNSAWASGWDFHIRYLEQMKRKA